MKLLNSFADVSKRVRKSPNIIIHSACAEPSCLIDLLIKEADQFTGATIYSLMPMVSAKYGDEGLRDIFNVVTFFPGPGLRKSVNTGLARIRRSRLSHIPTLFESYEIKADILLLHLSKPNPDGVYSLGVSVDYMHAVLDQNPIVIAQINPHMPFSVGETLINPSAIDYYIEHSEDLNYFESSLIGSDEEEEISNHAATIIEDGDVLQVGVGSLPDLVLSKLGHLKNLGIHSGVITDAMLPLIKSGAVNNATKKRFYGKSIATMAVGTSKLYEYISNNEAVELHPCSITHNLYVLSKIEKFCAVNSALQIDVFGNVNAESVGNKIVAAPGGLPDFCKGAKASKGGKSIILLRSSFNNGRASNILFSLDESRHTLAPHDIDYVITEFGVAKITGMNRLERARSIINIAHPNYRGDLLERISRAISESGP